MSGEMVPPQYSPSHAARSLTARDRARGGCQRARSFDSRVIESREKRGFARRLSSFYPLEQSFVFGFLMRSFGNPKITLRIKTRAFACKLCAFFILAIFGFRLVEAAKLRQAARSDCFGFSFRVDMYAPYQKRGFGAARYRVARHFLFRTTFGVRLRSRLGRLVCALLRFRERPRTIKVQRTTSSPQNHRKSLAQYSVVLFI